MLTDSIMVLNAAVSVSISRIDPLVATGRSKSRVLVISESDRDSVSIGREIVRASQKLAIAARANEQIAKISIARSAACSGSRVDAAIESSAKTLASPS